MDKSGPRVNESWKATSRPGSTPRSPGFNISYTAKSTDQFVPVVDEESDILSVRVAYSFGEWIFGVDGLENVPINYRNVWLDKCWASSVLPAINPTRLLKQDSQGVEIWACSGSDGAEICSVVKYDRNSQVHLDMFEKHFSFLLDTKSLYHMKLYGAYATAQSLCIVQQAVAGTMGTIVAMKQCGPMPEPILAVTLRCVLLALSDTLRLGFIPRSIDGNAWVSADAVKLGALPDFAPLPANPGEAAAAVRTALAELPRLVAALGGTPRERQNALGSEDLWAPSGLFPDANYAVMAGMMWPLRFRTDRSSRLHAFLALCAEAAAGAGAAGGGGGGDGGGGDDAAAAGAQAIERLLQSELVEAYAALRPGVPLQWCRVQVPCCARNCRPEPL